MAASQAFATEDTRLAIANFEDRNANVFITKLKTNKIIRPQYLSDTAEYFDTDWLRSKRNQKNRRPQSEYYVITLVNKYSKSIDYAMSKLGSKFNIVFCGSNALSTARCRLADHPLFSKSPDVLYSHFVGTDT